MKKRIITSFLGICAALAISFTGFSQIKASDLENVGKEHNAALEKIYAKLYAMNQSSGVGNIVESSSTEYLYTLNNYNKEDIKLGISILQNFVKSPTNVGTRLYNEKIGSMLSEKIKNYLDELNIILDGDYTDNSLLKITVSQFEIKISNDKFLTNSDLIILYAATNTAKYSFEYWSDNTAKWQQLNKNNAAAKNGPGKRIAKADVAGAVGGAVTAAAVNIIPGGGQVAYGGAIIGGAVGGSAYQAVSELLDWLW